LNAGNFRKRTRERFRRIAGPTFALATFAVFYEEELFVCGRIKDLIIVRGVKYSAHEIEAAVESASPQIQVGGVAAFRGDEDVETLILMAEVSVSELVPDGAQSHRLSARDAASSRSRSCGSALARFQKPRPARSRGA